MNKMIIKGKTVQLLGFPKLKDEVIFQLRPQAIIISSPDSLVPQPWHYKAEIKEGKIEDEKLVREILKRGIREEMNFVEINGHYFPIY